MAAYIAASADLIICATDLHPSPKAIPTEAPISRCRGKKKRAPMCSTILWRRLPQQERRRLFQQDREFVASDPGDGIGVAHALVESDRDLDEELVPGIVAEGVVDSLESVEVDVKEEDQVSRALGAMERGLRVLEISPRLAGP